MSIENKATVFAPIKRVEEPLWEEIRNLREALLMAYGFLKAQGGIPGETDIFAVIEKVLWPIESKG